MAVVVLNFPQSLEQMKQVIAATEITSDYVKGEIVRKRAIHDKDVADLIRHEHNAYYQKALDSSLAYDDLALHGERDLERVRGPFASLPSHLIVVTTARGFNHPRNKCFPGARIAAFLPASCDSIAGETCQDPSN